MIGLDTNVVIRYLVQDDKKQSAAATHFIETALTAEEPGYINAVTLSEIAWVLLRCYGVTKQQVQDIIEMLLTTKQLVVENVEVTWKALRTFNANSIDFSDALIGRTNIHNGCERTVTFDKKAARLPEFELL